MGTSAGPSRIPVVFHRGSTMSQFRTNNSAPSIPGIVNGSIPAFYIGRNKDGFGSRAR
jgi:hypothetical protein